MYTPSRRHDDSSSTGCTRRSPGSARLISRTYITIDVDGLSVCGCDGESFAGAMSAFSSRYPLPPGVIDPGEFTPTPRGPNVVKTASNLRRYRMVFQGHLDEGSLAGAVHLRRTTSTIPPRLQQALDNGIVPTRAFSVGRFVPPLGNEHSRRRLAPVDVDHHAVTPVTRADTHYDASRPAAPSPYGRRGHSFLAVTYLPAGHIRPPSRPPRHGTHRVAAISLSSDK
ncbi:hypothetical protein DFH07DRAFT_951483 [Mycena maculata]|uniref:Uncharacterized protein n=1 Tax=Mycena maculata TaxID=230809 RepID=A0AAD7NVI8_9AGAR|nr:hypothetical protein DFH07DRAFT_951483 [Mycena maculata]